MVIIDLATHLQLEFFGDREIKSTRIEIGVRHIGRQILLFVQRPQHPSAEQRLAGPDLSGDFYKAFTGVQGHQNGI